MRFLTPTHINIFLHLLIKKKPLEKGIQETTYTFSYEALKSEFKKIFFFFGNLKILKLGMLKNMTPKSQAKIKPQFSQYQFLTIF